MNYFLSDGRELYVTDGFSKGRTWFTDYTAKTGSTRRFKSPVLQCRKTREEAQEDIVDEVCAELIRAVGRYPTFASGIVGCG